MLRRTLLLLALALAVGPRLSFCPAFAAEGVQGSPSFALGPGDVLHVSVWKEEALTMNLTVRPDGRISFPLIGDVPAAGRDVEALRRDMAGRLHDFLPDAPVTVVLAELGSARVYVVGKVARPGMFLMPGETRIMQALALAGGLTPFADRTHILVLRTEDGARKAIPFDYERVSQGQDIGQDIALKPGDTVVVP